MKSIIGIDIGGTNFRIGAVGENGKVNAFHKLPVRRVFHTDDGLRDLTDYLRRYLEELAAAGLQPTEIVIGFPATLDKARTTVLQAPNIPFMENLPIKEGLQSALGLPVLMDKDVVMALCYDKAKYAIPACDVLLGCYFGTGIGNAIQIFGRIVDGGHGTAGELGHIPVVGSTVRCGCGNVGCMENLAGGKYLAHLCETCYPDTFIGDIFEKHGDEAPIQAFIDQMAIAVATEINILDPDHLLIGGGVVNMKAFPKEHLLACIAAHTRRPYPALLLDRTMHFTEDEEDKCVIGAALFAREKAN